jgi:hypothetical protein
MTFRFVGKTGGSGIPAWKPNNNVPINIPLSTGGSFI